MNYLSICSGIEAASQAFQPLGWRPVAFAEIEPFPSAVLAHHHPDVPNLGDMTQYPDWPEALLRDVDLLVGGTPCQSFSVSGLRQSLQDARGNLTLTLIHLYDRLAQIRAADPAGRPAPLLLWENVPGVLNTDDNAFGCFLGGLAGTDGPLQPPGDRWLDAGYVRGPTRAIAWRILDAQYFGLAQRRRRVFLVAGPRDGFHPEQILFEWDRLRRDTPPRRETGQETALGFEIGPSGGGPCDVTPTLDARCKDGPIRNQIGTCIADHAARETGQGHWTADQLASLRATTAPTQPQTIVPEEFQVVGTLSDGAHNGGGLNGQDAYSGRVLPVAFSARARGDDGRGYGREEQIFKDGLTGPLDTVKPHCIAFKPSHYTRGKDGAPQDIAPPLSADADKGDQDTLIAFDCKAGGNTGLAIGDIPSCLRGDGHGGGHTAIAFSSKDHGADATPDLSPPLRAMNAHHSHANAGGQIAICHAFQPRIARNGRGDMGELVSALNAESGETGKGDAAPCVAYTLHGTDKTVKVAGSIRTKPPGSIENSSTTVVAVGQCQGTNVNKVDLPNLRSGNGHVTGGVPFITQPLPDYRVRRLTPRECERLQGFPDDHTRIPYRGKPAQQCPDGPRYKALGNSMAVPVMHWIGRRLQQYLNPETPPNPEKPAAI